VLVCDWWVYFGWILAGVKITLPALTEKDKLDLTFGCQQVCARVCVAVSRSLSIPKYIQTHIYAHKHAYTSDS